MMHNKNHEPQYHNNNIVGVLVATVIGSLIGAVTMLLFAPQSGRDTRMQIQEKGIQLRDRTTELVEDAVAQVRSGTHRLTHSGREKFQELKQQGQGLAFEQLDRVSSAAQAGKKAIQSS
jgi:gas vesicle protein